MTNTFEFVATSCSTSGKSAARKIRREGGLPAIVYGDKSKPQVIILDHNKVSKQLEQEAVYSHILDLKINKKTHKVVLKAVQRHPVKAQILHLDFLRINEEQVLKAKIPLHFINENMCEGVKSGGVVTHAMVDVEVSCLPANLPQYIEVDLAALDIGDAIHLSDLTLPKGVDIAALSQEGHDHTVAQAMKVKVQEEEVVVEEESEEEQEQEQTEEEK